MTVNFALFNHLLGFEKITKMLHDIRAHTLRVTYANESLTSHAGTNRISIINRLSEYFEIYQSNFIK